jgi:hypothetical protein
VKDADARCLSLRAVSAINRRRFSSDFSSTPRLPNEHR